MKQKKNPNASRGHGSGVQMGKSPSWPSPSGPGSLRGHTPIGQLVDVVRAERDAKEYYRRELSALRAQHEDEKARYYASLGRGFWAEVWHRMKQRWAWLAKLERRKKIDPVPSGPDDGQRAARITPTIDEENNNQNAQPAA